MICRGCGYRIDCYKASYCILQSCPPEVVDGTTTAAEGKADDTVKEDAGCFVDLSILNHNFLLLDCWASKFLK